MRLEGASQWAEWLLRERQRQGLRRWDLAEEAHVGATTLAQWEKGLNTPMLPAFLRTCKALGFEVRLERIAKEED